MTTNDQLEQAPEQQTDETPDAPETPQDAPQGDEAAEPAEDADEAELVRSLRSESRSRKEKVRALETKLSELETELAEHRRFRVEAAVAEAAGTGPDAINRSMENPSDLLDHVDPATLVDDAGRPDAEKIGAAIDDLLERKPHLRRRWGSADGGTRSTPIQQPESLGALIGAAARGYDR